MSTQYAGAKLERSLGAGRRGGGGGGRGCSARVISYEINCFKLVSKEISRAEHE